MAITVGNLIIPTSGTGPKLAAKGTTEDAVEGLVQGVVDQLGTAAERDTGEFASSAQGARADTAIQPAALASEVVDRANADNALGVRISAEQSARTSADNALGVRIDGLSSGIFYAGTFDPAGGSFPSGSLRGGTYRATSSGTVGGQVFDIGDRITAKVDGASTSVFAGNWDRASTSAELADLDAKFSDTLRFYGAVGDGVTNDTAAVTAAEASGLEYIDMEGLTYSTTSQGWLLAKKYYNGKLFVRNKSGNISLMPNSAPVRDSSLQRLGTKSKYLEWDGSNVLWLGTSIPHWGATTSETYPDVFSGLLGCAVVNKAWSGSHATFSELSDIDPNGSINQVKSLSMTAEDVAAGVELYGSGSVFGDSYDVATKATSMTLEARIATPFQATDFDVVVLDHAHNDRRNTWGTLNPVGVSGATSVNLSLRTRFFLADANLSFNIGDFVVARTTGVTGLDYCYGRVVGSTATNVTIAYDSSTLAGTLTSATLYKLDRSTVYGAWEAVIYAIKNSSIRYGSGNVEIILAGAPSEYTGNTYDISVRSVATAIRSVADKYGLSFFDVAESMKVTAGDHLNYFPDAVHPTTAASRKVLASHWADWATGGKFYEKKPSQLSYQAGSGYFSISDASSGGNVSLTKMFYTYTRIGEMVFINGLSTGIDTGGLTSENQLYFSEMPFAPNTRNLSIKPGAYISGSNPPSRLGVKTSSNGTFRLSITGDTGTIGYVRAQTITSDVSRVELSFSYTTDE